MRKRIINCPSCGLPVVMDDATRTINHAKPLCTNFEFAMERAGMKPDPLTGQVKEPGQA